MKKEKNAISAEENKFNESEEAAECSHEHEHDSETKNVDDLQPNLKTNGSNQDGEEIDESAKMPKWREFLLKCALNPREEKRL